MDLYGISLHESGHALGYLSASVRVTELFACGTRGHCRRESGGRPEGLIIATLAGAAAVEVLHGATPAAALSEADRESLADEERRWQDQNGAVIDTRRRRHWQHLAGLMAWEHGPAIRALAAELRVRGTMRETDIAGFVHRPDGTLSQFRHLYPRPLAKSTSTPAKALSTPNGLPVDARWSAEHNCYLARVRPGPGTRSVRTGASFL